MSAPKMLLDQFCAMLLMVSKRERQRWIAAQRAGSRERILGDVRWRVAPRPRGGH